MNKLFSLIFFFLPLLTWGQNTECYPLEAPALTGTYGIETGLMPGDQAFSLGDLPVSLALIQYPDGSEGFMNLTIGDDIFGDTGPLEGQSVFMGNLSMVVDFTGLSAPVTEVCFDFLDGGGVENFSVNGQPVAVVPHLGELMEEIAPGVTLSIDFLDNFNSAGTLCLQGNIESLLIGGQEFGLDNLCVTTGALPCHIFDLVAEPQPCTPNGVFFVDLSFEFENVGNDGYQIVGNGNNYGTFSYDDPFPTLGPFLGDGEMVFEFIVKDIQNPDCQAEVGLGPIDCFPECEITHLSAYLNECGIQNAPYLLVDFDFANVQNVGFDLFLNNEFFGFYSYDDLPLQLYDFPAEDAYFIEVCENDDPGCCAATQVDIIECAPDSCITFTGLDTGTTFNPANGFAAGDTAFVAAGVAVTLDSFSYFDGSAGFFSAQVVDDSFDDFDLAEGNHLFVSNLNLTFDFDAVEGEVVSVCFDFFDGGGEENITVNGQPVEVVSVLTDVPYEIAPGVTFSLDLQPGSSDFLQTGTACLTGPIHSLTLGGQEFAVDNVCFSSYVPDDDCGLFNLTVESSDCEPNGNVYLSVDFNYENVSDEGFRVRVNGGNWGAYGYDELPVAVGPFWANGETDFTVQVSDLSNPDCETTVVTDSLDCAPGCGFFDLTAEAVDTLENNQTVFLVDFAFENPLTDIFGVYANGEPIGFFEYGALPVEVIAPCSNESNIALTVCDGEVFWCCATIYPEIPNCEPGDCQIFDVFVEPYECDGDGFLVDLAFESQNTGNDGFQVTVNNEIFGPFSYEEPFVTLGPFPGDGQTPLNFFIQDLQHPDCAAEAFLEPIDCGTGDCHIFDLVAEPQPCTPNGVFFVDIQFEFANVGNDGYQIVGNGNDYGNFSYNDPFPTLGPFIGDGQTVYEFVVRDLQHPDCQTFTVIEPVDCPVGDCVIYDLVVDPHSCGDDGFLIYVAFQSQNTGNDGFNVLVNNEFFGPFSYDAPFITLGPFPGDGMTEYVVEVRDANDPDCVAETTVGPIECSSTDCNLSAGHILEVSCLETGAFTLTFDFEYENTSDGFMVFIGDFDTDPIGYGELPYTLELGPEFPHSGQLIICDLLQDGCCLEIPYEVDCFECSLEDLVLEVQSCDEEGFFYVDIDVAGFNTSDEFTLFVGGGGGETYAYSQLPLTIGPFLGDGQHPTQFLIQDASGQCAIDGHIEPVFCADVCSITNLIVEPYDCVEGEFFVDVEIQAFNPGPLGYFIFADGVINGPFSYDEVFVTLGPFPADGETVYDFLVLDIANPACFAYDEIGPIDCEEEGCGVSDLDIDVLSCAGNGTFTIRLDFNYQHPGNDFFDFFVNNQLFDFFPLGNLPVVIDGIPLGDGGEIAFKVCINDQPDCCHTLVITAPDCEAPLVWPGDANSDNIAHHFDLLNIGVAYGWQGPDRSNLSIEWDGMPAEPWTPTFADGVNYAHADCNGDGVIDALDRVAIVENYSLTHGPVAPYVPPMATDDDPVLFIDWPNLDPTPGGASFEAPVVIGTNDLPVTDLYGIAFTIVFDPEVINPGSVAISYPNGWFGTPDLNVLTVDRSFADEGRIEVALTRIDQEEVTGNGALCMIGGIIDDIAGMAESQIGIEKPRAIRFNETPIPLRTPTTAFEVISKVNSQADLDPEQLRVYPNPTVDRLYLETPDGTVPEQVQLITAQGQLLTLPTSEGERLSLAGLPAGVYWLKVRWKGRVINRRIVKLKR